VVPPVIVNVMELCPTACGAPFNVHSEKVYTPVESVAGAWRFTLVPYTMPGTV
jgi:hypothetical protein